MLQTMTMERVHWFLDLFEELGLAVWLDGGWGVDALLGEQTRVHQDLDIMLRTTDAGRLVEALRVRGFVDVPTDDRSDINFVMGHEDRGLVDFHVFESSSDGSGIYGPGTQDWRIAAEELAATGEVGGRSVRCLSAEHHVRSHTGYELKETDFADMAALQHRFGVTLLPEQLPDL